MCVYRIQHGHRLFVCASRVMLCPQLNCDVMPTNQYAAMALAWYCKMCYTCSMILKSVHGMIHAGVFRTDTACGATAVTAGLLCPCFPQCQPPPCLALPYLCAVNYCSLSKGFIIQGFFSAENVIAKSWLISTRLAPCCQACYPRRTPRLQSFAFTSFSQLISYNSVESEPYGRVTWLNVSTVTNPWCFSFRVYCYACIATDRMLLLKY